MRNLHSLIVLWWSFLAVVPVYLIWNSYKSTIIDNDRTLFLHFCFCNKKYKEDSLCTLIWIVFKGAMNILRSWDRNENGKTTRVLILKDFAMFVCWGNEYVVTVIIPQGSSQLYSSLLLILMIFIHDDLFMRVYNVIYEINSRDI